MKSDEKCNALHRSGILLHPIAIGNIRIPGGKMVGHISFIFLFVCRMAVCYLFFIQILHYSQAVSERQKACGSTDNGATLAVCHLLFFSLRNNITTLPRPSATT